MVQSKAASVSQYLAELPVERRAVVSKVRDLVNAHMPPGYKEAMAFGMIGWGIPLSRYPKTYNKQPLDAIGELIASMSVDDYIAVYEASR